MQCPRCHGLMVVETFYDWGRNQLTYDYFEGERCVSCGNVWDRVIAANRADAGGAFTSRRRRILALRWRDR